MSEASIMESTMSNLQKYQISNFFKKNSGITQPECDKEAERITGIPATPSAVQGGTSYSVVTGESVIQFRNSESALNLELLKCVEQAYAGFVPKITITGDVGGILVYRMNNIGGISMYLARHQLYRDNCHLLQQTLKDYAKFFASAWHNTPKDTPSPNRDQLFKDYSSELTQLSQGLPERFRETLDSLILRLPSLFTEDWPMVPNHIYLLEDNIYVDPITGKLMGICEWGGAEVSPFGMSLGGLDTLLGISRTTGWCYHANYQALRALFWDEFYKALGTAADDRIEVARLIGIFRANGWKSNSDGNRVPVWEETFELNYLDAVVLGIFGKIKPITG